MEIPLELQKAFFEFDITHPNIRAVVQDGHDFLVAQPDHSYNLIFVDGGSLMSITESAAALLSSKLVQDGVVGFNAFYEDDWNRDKIHSLQKHYGEVWVFQTTSVNAPIIAAKKATLHTKQTLSQAAAVLEHRLHTKLPFTKVVAEQVSVDCIYTVRGFVQQS